MNHFRDPRGWIIDKLPWRLRRVYIAPVMRVKVRDVPDDARLIGCRRPPQSVFDDFGKMNEDRLAARIEERMAFVAQTARKLQDRAKKASKR